ncbi:MAG: exodeoxyribonuclease VII large subunit [Alphaproteobacteria bacterium]|nr:MAG: exodeoxyribonuclease VII large subunit [Rickettsiaceae bacterium 4572_127]
MKKPEPVLNLSEVVSVSFLSNLLKGVVETAFTRIKVRGEITGCKKHSSGHYYLDLKEKAGGKDYVLNGIIWKWTRLSVVPENGMEVVATGKITTYAGRSTYNITIEELEVEGEGLLLKKIEDLKKKLSAEGLFDSDRKKQIPYLPKKIGVVTSETGAVFRDILHRISDRFPVEVVLWSCAVQGAGAEKKIAEGIAGFNKMSDRPDVLIVARGGGSLQDLMPFNEEIVVRAVADSEIPVISAVGHETDTTLIDFVSDLRAPTPTGAAEKAVPVRTELISKIEEKRRNLWRNLIGVLKIKKLNFDAKIAKIRTPMHIVEDQIRRLDDKSNQLVEKMKYRLEKSEQNVISAGKLLESYSFKKVLKRGFSIAKGENGIVSSAEIAKKSKPISLLFHDGEIEI